MYTEAQIKDLFMRMYGKDVFSAVPVTLNLSTATAGNFVLTPTLDSKSIFFGNISGNMCPSTSGTNAGGILKLNSYNLRTASVEQFHQSLLHYIGLNGGNNSLAFSFPDSILYSVSATDVAGNTVYSLQLVGWKITFN